MDKDHTVKYGLEHSDNSEVKLGVSEFEYESFVSRDSLIYFRSLGLVSSTFSELF